MTDRLHHLDAWRSTPYDAVIVGGGPAGLSAALVLGRARKRVLVVDNDRPANAVSQGVGGLLGHDRVKPADLRASGRRQLEEHATVEFRHGAVEDAERMRDGFVVRPTDGSPVRTHAIVLAHGLRYDPPPLPGIEALSGPVGVPLRVLRRLGSARPADWRSTAAALPPCVRRSCSPVGATMSCSARTARRTRVARCWQKRACESGRIRSRLAGTDDRLEQIELDGPAERRKRCS